MEIIVREAVKRIKDPIIRNRLYTNIETQGRGFTLDETVEANDLTQCLDLVVGGFFSWGSTPEGANYWFDVQNKIYSGEVKLSNHGVPHKYLKKHKLCVN